MIAGMASRIAWLGLLPLACTMPNPAFGLRDEQADDEQDGASASDASDATVDGTSDASSDDASSDASSDSSTSDPSTDTSTSDPDTSTETSGGPLCGDGNIDPREECDDGNLNPNDSCTDACTDSICGDGVVHIGAEQCDDGNLSSTDECTNTCNVAVCGDGFVWEGVEQCDEPGFDTCTQDCKIEYRLAFVSSQAHYVDEIAGLEHADEICQMHAQNALLPGTYKAWLSDGVSSPSNRFNHFQGHYKTTSNPKVTIAASWNALIDGALDVPIMFTEAGTPVPDAMTCSELTRVWTGTQPNGTSHPGHCGGFTSTEGLGTIGFAGGFLATWTVCSTMQSCATAARLYCFQQ